MHNIIYDNDNNTISIFNNQLKICEHTLECKDIAIIIDCGIYLGEYCYTIADSQLDVLLEVRLSEDLDSDWFISNGFIRLGTDNLINPNGFDYIKITPERYSLDMVLVRKNKSRFSIVDDIFNGHMEFNYDEIEKYLDVFLENGILCILDVHVGIRLLDTYTNYIKKFKEKYSEKVLLWELNWKGTDEYDKIF